MIGKAFGRLTVISDCIRKNKRKYWECRCECGVVKYVYQYHLTSGRSQSCGCLIKDAASAKFTKHGMSSSKISGVWYTIKSRCTNPNYREWAMYGGRGIKICDRWLSFENFYSDMGDAPFARAQIDRIDNNGDYSLENCRWATPAENARNRRSNVRFSLSGEMLTIPEMSERYNLSQKTLWNRIQGMGWSVERAVAEPIHYRGQK